MNKNNQNRAPLFDALRKYVNDKTIPFHVPGHKQGNTIDAEFKDFLGQSIFKIDLTTFKALDSLHKPVGVIKEAQELASEVYGSDYSFFCINGTSGAILAMIMSVVKEKEKILIPRNVHKSITAAIILSGAIPIYMEPEIDNYLGIAHGVSCENVLNSLNKNRDAKAVLIINPTYYGVSTDIKKITQIVHSFNIPLIVDEAHGPHLYFSNKLPSSALEAGCDMCAQSTHKLLTSLTQSSMLHIKSKFINPQKVQQILNLLQTTSPSYILMSSLDTCRRQMALKGKELIESSINLAQYARNKINEIPGLYCFGNEIINKKGIYDVDPTKLTICCRKLGITGYELYNILSKEYNIQLELADFYNVLAICSLGDNKNSIDALIYSLSKISNKLCKNKELKENFLNLPSIPEQILDPRKAFFTEKETYPLNESIGKISGEFILSYPPGIPILCPGEIITEEIIKYVYDLKKAGLNILGTEDITSNTIKIIKKSKNF